MKPVVLIIEDSLTNVVLVEAILKPEDITVVRAFSVDQAFEILVREKINLVILDIMLQGKDGREFLKQREKNESISAIPVIVTSAISNKTEIAEIKKFRIDYFFQKPLEIHLFLKTVKKLLTR